MTIKYYKISTDALTYISKDFLAYQYLCGKNQWNNLIPWVFILNENKAMVTVTDKYIYLQLQNAVWKQ